MALFHILKKIRSIPIKGLIVVVKDFGILYKASKLPVLCDKCIEKSMVVCNLIERCIGSLAVSMPKQYSNFYTNNMSLDASRHRVRCALAPWVVDYTTYTICPLRSENYHIDGKENGKTCMHWLKCVRLNRKDRLKNMHGTTLEVAMLADVSRAYSVISSVYQCVT